MFHARHFQILTSVVVCDGPSFMLNRSLLTMLNELELLFDPFESIFYFDYSL